MWVWTKLLSCILIILASFKAAALEKGVPEVGFHPHGVDEMAVYKLDTQWEIACPFKADIFKGDIFKTNIVEMHVLERDIFEVHVSCHLVVQIAVLPVLPVHVTVSPLRSKVSEPGGPHCCKDG